MHDPTSNLLYIEPTNEASSTPLIDDLTRKITAAYREAEPMDGFWRGVHTCVCGANSSSQDYFLPDGTMTNSLCVHYIAFHRNEIPFHILEQVSSLPYGQCTPVEEELRGGRSLESAPSDYFGKKRLASLEAAGVDLRTIYNTAINMSVSERGVQFRLLEIFQCIPDAAIGRFKRAVQPADLEPVNWLRNASAPDGYTAATIKPLTDLLHSSNEETSSWAIFAIDALAQKVRTTHLNVDNEGGHIIRHTGGFDKHQVCILVSLLHDILRNDANKKLHLGAIQAMGSIGPPAEIAVKTIYELMRKCDSLEGCALQSLCKIGNWAEVAVPRRC